MVCLRDLLQLEQLEELEVIAGKGGTGTSIETVTVMEVPDIVQYLKGNDFLITSLYFVGNDKDKQMEVVQNLIESPCACLGIKMGRYVDELSSEVQQLAEEHNFPILRIPPTLTYIDIIMTIMNTILIEKDMEGVREKLIHDILFGSKEKDYLLIERAKLLNILLDKTFFQVMVVKNMVTEALNQFDTKYMKFMSKQLCVYVEGLAEVKSCHLLLLESHAVLLCAGYTKKSLENANVNITREIKRRMPSEKKASWKIGIGSSGKGVTEIRKSYSFALDMIQLGYTLKQKENLYCYKELDIYCHLQTLFLKSSTTFYKEMFSKIESKELLETVEVYYDCNCNLDATAKRLFAHKNTVKYRLNKLKELTGLDVKSQEDSFKLQFMLLEKKIMEQNEREE